ncbi:Transient receptor putative cation channel subfamily A member 1 [Saxophila tyrrhenica]|uniref:Transient receptor putative cation channel subfamily A member 1 n=1 Tax=Saxophila tyrrhenica TaxID=1690608 RepID=A0AAV9PPR6_9PEZI|nr:Transient receptor putative cation channel subfamily A member 1 [Saxophila tyrrhenica]
MSEVELSALSASHTQPVESPRPDGGVDIEDHDASGTAEETSSVASHSIQVNSHSRSPTQIHAAPAQPQSPASASSSGGDAATLATNGNADRRSSQASTFATSIASFRSWVSSASSALSVDQLSSCFGISIDVQEDGGKRTWLIKVTRLGRWIIPFHLILAAAGIFDVVSTIYAWTTSRGADRMQQRTLQSVLKTGSRLEGMEHKFQKWFEEATALSSGQREQLREEQRLWDALVKMFENCGTQSGLANATDACAEGRRYFQENPLPQVNKSPLAKRNLAKIDVIIRRDHLHLSSGESGSSAWAGQHLLHTLAIASVLCLSTLAAFFLYFALWRWGPALRRKVQNFSKKRWFGHGKSLEVVVDDGDEKYVTTTAYSSGGDHRQPQGSITFRGPRIPNVYTLAVKGAWTELAKLPASQMQVDSVDTANEYGSLLTAAVRSGDLQTVNYILSRGAMVDVLGGRYHNSLQTAAHSGSNAIVERLLQAGATDASTGGFYGSSIHAAAEKGDCYMLKTLLTSGKIANGINELGGTFGTPLIAAAARAAANGHLEIVSMLHHHGCALNALSTVYGTPLHAACSTSRPKVAEFLLRSGANPSVEDQRRRTPLHAAVSASEGMHAIIDTILDTKPHVADKRDSDGQTALHLASIAGDADAVKALLRYGAKWSIGDKFNAQPLFRAAGCGFPEVVHVLLKIGRADPNAADCFGRTALHGPAQTSDVRVHKYLIDYGADVNVTGNDRKTPLHEACNMGRIENAKLLLERDEILVNELDNDQFAPLYKALCSSDAHPDYLGKCVDPGIVDLLLERQDIDVNVSSGIAVQEAARKGMVHVVRRMIDRHGANLQMQGGKYGGVLQAAAISGNLALLNMLLDPRHRADVNQTGGEFGCPLSAAAAYGHVEIVQRLLEAGADACNNGVGRYGSPLQSMCRQLENPGSFTWTSKSTPIFGLIKEYGGDEALQPVEKPYSVGWRWLITPTGWTWVPPGEM